MNNPTKQPHTLLVAGLTPSFLGKPVLWWDENESEILAKRALTPLWRDHTTIVEQGATLSQSAFLRSLADLGYEKVFNALFPGTFKHLGSTILVFPINKAHSYAVDFVGNIVESIEERSESIPEVEPRGMIRARGSTSGFKGGDYVVHIDHGIGIFRGIRESRGEHYFNIEYAPARPGGEPDRLLVPVEEKKRLEPYLGLDQPRVHRLGTSLWATTKRKAREDIIAFAKSLIHLYRARTVQKRPPYPADSVELEIWDAFDYPLTQDQAKALDEILGDLARETPMERLLTGDVGFGKTEIALRAALRVALAGKQVAVLVPTTVLADQHLQTFTERLKKTALSVAALTRLSGKAVEHKTLVALERGTLDIVIGTHRMFSRDVVFKNLGLLVIDEEQRSGVRHKEHFKEKYPALDILSLSATPIPRTLAFSVAGVRPFSQIQEAPLNRKAPLTAVLPFSKKLVREALSHELARRGQAYFLASRIRTIPKTLAMLADILPEAQVGAIHGRMPEKEILATMHRFRARKLDILVSTTIIENGLDISSANTLVVEDAALLGLAQAHQLRGRVGRSAEQAFAYFLYHPRHLTPDAERRLGYLLEFDALGAGLDIARRDLELRGAGAILGRDQSGVANRIGWNLYFQFMNEALESPDELM